MQGCPRQSSTPPKACPAAAIAVFTSCATNPQCRRSQNPTARPSMRRSPRAEQRSARRPAGPRARARSTTTVYEMSEARETPVTLDPELAQALAAQLELDVRDAIPNPEHAAPLLRRLNDAIRRRHSRAVRLRRIGEPA